MSEKREKIENYLQYKCCKLSLFHYLIAEWVIQHILFERQLLVTKGSLVSILEIMEI